jgi:hypothetical protein
LSSVEAPPTADYSALLDSFTDNTLERPFELVEQKLQT